MKPLAKVVCCLCCVFSAESVEAEDIRTTDGLVYKNVTISRVEKDGINIVHATGAAKIPFERLPVELQRRYNFDKEAAMQYRAAVEQQRKTEEDSRRAAQVRADNEQKLADQRRVAAEAKRKQEVRELSERQHREERLKKTTATVTAGTVLLIALALYFLPAIVGARKDNAFAIFMLNLLAGWTFIGWIVAMVWACTKDARELQRR